MFNPEKYIKANELQYAKNQKFLSDILPKIKWLPEGGDVILDGGCGPGNSTYHNLLKVLPKNFGSLTACDISEKTIAAAKNNFSHPKLQFVTLDLGTKDLPFNMIGAYDHIFSFFCMHWVTDQRQLYSNMNSFLKPNGNLIFTIVTKGTLYDIQFELMDDPRFKKETKGPETVICPYYYDSNPENTLRKYLETAGFEVISFETDDTGYYFNDKDLWLNSFNTLNTSLTYLEGPLKKEYQDAYLRKLEEKGCIQKKDNKLVYYFPFTFCSILATKTNNK